MVDFGYEFKYRNNEVGKEHLASEGSCDPEPTFPVEHRIPFHFKIKLPPPRYYPIILKRDDFGKILATTFPPEAV